MASDPNRRIRLQILGLSYREIQQGAYALILSETDGPRHIPIVIGSSEAQSIALRLEHITPPRPVTHDLFASFAHAFGIRLREVFIHKFEDGIFASELLFSDDFGHEVTLDARTSDAIAIAIRTRSPIFTTPEIIEETGFVMESSSDDSSSRTEVREVSLDDVASDKVTGADPLDDMTIEQLEAMLSKLIAEELYEEAAHVSEVIKRKRENPDPS